MCVSIHWFGANTLGYSVVLSEVEEVEVEVANPETNLI